MPTTTFRMLDGFLLVNKPKGISSFSVIPVIRGLTGVKKVGHAGTLDPMASGLLVIAIGRGATPRLKNFLQDNKTYIAEITLGKESDTYDMEGIVQDIDVKKIPPIEEVKKAIAKFKGKISQMPPIYSAKKINGQRAYKLARAGEEVKLTPKIVEIYKAELLKYSWPKVEIEFRVSSGTYIRSIAHDLGGALGTGAVLSGLIRSAQGNFRLNESVKFDDLTPNTIKKNLIII